MRPLWPLSCCWAPFPPQRRTAGRGNRRTIQTRSQSPAPTTATDVDSRYDYTKIFDLNNTRYDGASGRTKRYPTAISPIPATSGNTARGISDHTGRVTITKGSGEDFLVSYSALASTTTVLSETASPIDLVFVLDMSPMSNSAAGKLNSMLTAVEAAVEAMMGLNPNNRVGIVAYSSQAECCSRLGTIPR